MPKNELIPAASVFVCLWVKNEMIPAAAVLMHAMCVWWWKMNWSPPRVWFLLWECCEQNPYCIWFGAVTHTVSNWCQMLRQWQQKNELYFLFFFFFLHSKNICVYCTAVKVQVLLGLAASTVNFCCFFLHGWCYSSLRDLLDNVQSGQLIMLILVCS